MSADATVGYTLGARLHSLHLCLTTWCQLCCSECSANIPGMRHPEHYDAAYIQAAAACLHGVENVCVTGGEPTSHPQFGDIVCRLREWFGCRRLTLETNGYKIREWAAVLPHFDGIWLSHYPQNQADIEFVANNFHDCRPPGPTIHLTNARRARRPAPCYRANHMLFVYGRLYPCARIPDGWEESGIPLSDRWRQQIVAARPPCHDCCFAEEADILSAPAMPDQIADACAPKVSPRPAWRWPQPRDAIRMYGLDLDSWMGREATIEFARWQHDQRLLIELESASPPEIYPLVLTLTDGMGRLTATCHIAHAGNYVVTLSLPQAVTHGTQIHVQCDKTFSELANGRGRELGVRIRSLRYLPCTHVAGRNRLVDWLYGVSRRVPSAPLCAIHDLPYSDSWLPPQVYFALPNRQQAKMLRVRLSSRHTPLACLPLQFTVRVNNRQAKGRLLVATQGEHLFEISLPPDLGTQPVVEVQLTADRSFVPAFFGVADQRPLTCQLLEISLM